MALGGPGLRRGARARTEGRTAGDAAGRAELGGGAAADWRARGDLRSAPLGAARLDAGSRAKHQLGLRAAAAPLNTRAAGHVAAGPRPRPALRAPPPQRARAGGPGRRAAGGPRSRRRSKPPWSRAEPACTRPRLPAYPSGSRWPRLAGAWGGYGGGGNGCARAREASTSNAYRSHIRVFHIFPDLSCTYTPEMKFKSYRIPSSSPLPHLGKSRQQTWISHIKMSGTKAKAGSVSSQLPVINLKEPTMVDRQPASCHTSIPPDRVVQKHFHPCGSAQRLPVSYARKEPKPGP